MGTLPTVTVLLDNGTGTFPYDISRFVLGTDGFGISRGRDDWQGGVTAGELTLMLNNSDGRFSPGSTIIATPSPITVDQRIRVIATIGGSGFGGGAFGAGPFGGGAYTLCTAYVKSWPVSWPATVPTFAEVQLSAVDAQARAERRTLKSMAEEQVLLTGTGMLYTLDESTGSTGAADTSGNQRPSLQIVNLTAGPITGTVPEFGVDLGLPEGQVGVKFTGNLFNTTILRQDAGGSFSSSGISYTFVVVCASPGGPPGQDWTPVTISGGAPQIDSAGKVSWNTALSQNICDGLPHVVTASAGAGHVTEILVDGALVASGPTLATTWADTFTAISGNLTVGVESVIGQVSIGPRLSTADAQAIHAGLRGFIGESSTARITRLAGYAKIPVGTLDASATNVAAQNAAGNSAWDAIQQVADAEGGVAFIDGSGNLAFHNRARPSGKTAPDLTLSSQYITPDVQPVVDDQRLVNYVEATAAGTGLKSLAFDQTSQNAHGRYSESNDYLVLTDREAFDRANWIVTKLATPRTRYGTLTINLYAMTPAMADTVLQKLDLDCWLRVIMMPGQNPDGTVADVMVQGFHQDVTNESWTATCNVVSRSLYTALILDDATFGALDSYPILF